MFCSLKLIQSSSNALINSLSVTCRKVTLADEGFRIENNRLERDLGKQYLERKELLCTNHQVREITFGKVFVTSCEMFAKRMK